METKDFILGYGAGKNSSLSEKIVEEVDAWLDEHITNPDSPPLDRSLTSSSAAAPADIVGDLKNTLKNIVLDFSWVGANKKYDLATGEVGTLNTFSITAKVFGKDFKEQFNYTNFTPSGSNNYISLWLGDTYVGYYFRGKYRDSSGTVITEPSYDNWALTCLTSDISNFHTYTVLTEKDLAEIESQISTLAGQIESVDDRTTELITEFTYTSGYLKYANGTHKNDSSGKYHYSNKQKGSQFAFANPAVYNLHANYNYVSFWNNGTYVGYYLDGAYYDPASTEVSSLTYDEWAVNTYDDSIALKPVSVDSRLDALEQHSSSRYDHLYGKKIAFLGDSITNGVGASDSAHSYVGLMENEFGSGNVGEYGINATLIAVVEGQKPTEAMCLRYADMPNNFDIVVVYGGTNDWYFGGEWGTVDSTDNTTFLGALNVLMSGLVQKYCGKEIIFVTPMSSDYNNKNTDNQNPTSGKTMKEYRDAIIERATYHGIPVIDLYGMCGMDIAHNAANKTYYSYDGVHPNDAGHKRVHDRIVTFISNMIY